MCSQRVLKQRCVVVAGHFRVAPLTITLECLYSILFSV